MSDNKLKLIVGLGNPGPQYQHNRHNVGVWFLDAIARRYQGELRAEARFHGMTCRLTAEGQDLRLLFPTTFMNRSGLSVATLVNYFNIAPSEMLVAYDEIDFPVGTTRLKTGGGHGGHNAKWLTTYLATPAKTIPFRSSMISTRHCQYYPNYSLANSSRPCKSCTARHKTRQLRHLTEYIYRI